MANANKRSVGPSALMRVVWLLIPRVAPLAGRRNGPSALVCADGMNLDSRGWTTKRTFGPGERDPTDRCGNHRAHQGRRPDQSSSPACSAGSKTVQRFRRAEGPASRWPAPINDPSDLRPWRVVMEWALVPRVIIEIELGEFGECLGSSGTKVGQEVIGEVGEVDETVPVGV
jgi:hypothetical protein